MIAAEIAFVQQRDSHYVCGGAGICHWNPSLQYDPILRVFKESKTYKSQSTDTLWIAEQMSLALVDCLHASLFPESVRQNEGTSTGTVESGDFLFGPVL
jgi:hypothetical protein